MLTPLPPRFIDQDSAAPIPNLNTNSIVGPSARLALDFPVERADRIYLTLSSTVLGGEYNQSFDVAQDAPGQELLIPRRFVEASTGTIVSLLLQIRRGRLITPAPTARVSINSLPIVVPPAPTVWTFNDGTFQGWVPQGLYVGNSLRVINSSVVVDQRNSQATSSYIITRSVPVVPGRIYDCSFEVIGGTAASDGSILCMRLDSGETGPDVQSITQAQVQTGTLTFTAPSTGYVRLGIFNRAVPFGLHRLSLRNIRMSARP